MKVAALAAAAIVVAGGLVPALTSAGGDGAAGRLLELQLNGHSTASRVVHYPTNQDPGHLDVGKAEVTWQLRFRFRTSDEVFSWKASRGSKLAGSAHFVFATSIFSADCKLKLSRKPLPGSVFRMSPTQMTLEIANPFEWVDSCGPGTTWFLPNVPLGNPSYNALQRARWLRFAFNPKVVPSQWSHYGATWPLTIWDNTTVKGSWKFRARMRVVVAPG